MPYKRIKLENGDCKLTSVDPVIWGSFDILVSSRSRNSFKGTLAVSYREAGKCKFIKVLQFINIFQMTVNLLFWVAVFRLIDFEFRKFVFGILNPGNLKTPSEQGRNKIVTQSVKGTGLILIQEENTYSKKLKETRKMPLREFSKINSQTFRN